MHPESSIDVEKGAEEHAISLEVSGSRTSVSAATTSPPESIHSLELKKTLVLPEKHGNKATRYLQCEVKFRCALRDSDVITQIISLRHTGRYLRSFSSPTWQCSLPSLRTTRAHPKRQMLWARRRQIWWSPSSFDKRISSTSFTRYSPAFLISFLSTYAAGLLKSITMEAHTAVPVSPPLSGSFYMWL